MRSGLFLGPSTFGSVQADGCSLRGALGFATLAAEGHGVGILRHSANPRATFGSEFHRESVLFGKWQAETAFTVSAASVNEQIQGPAVSWSDATGRSQATHESDRGVFRGFNRVQSPASLTGVIASRRDARIRGCREPVGHLATQPEGLQPARAEGVAYLLQKRLLVGIADALAGVHPFVPQLRLPRAAIRGGIHGEGVQLLGGQFRFRVHHE